MHRSNSLILFNSSLLNNRKSISHSSDFDFRVKLFYLTKTVNRIVTLPLKLLSARLTILQAPLPTLCCAFSPSAPDEGPSPPLSRHVQTWNASPHVHSKAKNVGCGTCVCIDAWCRHIANYAFYKHITREHLFKPRSRNRRTYAACIMSLWGFIR